jgi:hypothetical protein
MMSHRAYGGGMEGQIPGNLITRTLFTSLRSLQLMPL